MKICRRRRARRANDEEAIPDNGGPIIRPPPHGPIQDEFFDNEIGKLKQKYIHRNCFMSQIFKKYKPNDSK